MSIVFLNINEAIEINKRAVEGFGGLYGIRDYVLLESALQNTKNIYFYNDANLFEIATCYAFSIIQNHAFLDGNKRTAFACMTIFLALNDAEIDFDVDKTVDMMVSIATKSVSFADVVGWLKFNEV